MNFEQLQQTWRKEMQSTAITRDFSFEKLASCANEISREHRFTANLFTFVAIAIISLSGFLLLTGSIPPTPFKLLQLIGTPLLFAYAAVLYFKAVRDHNDTDWTLAAKLHNEKEKLGRQVELYRKLPTHMLLPMFLIIVIGSIPGFLNSFRDGTPVWRPVLYLVSVTVIFFVSAWALKRTEKNKLRPVMHKLEQLENQLKET